MISKERLREIEKAHTGSCAGCCGLGGAEAVDMARELIRLREALELLINMKTYRWRDAHPGGPEEASSTCLVCGAWYYEGQPIKHEPGCLVASIRALLDAEKGEK